MCTSKSNNTWRKSHFDQIVYEKSSLRALWNCPLGPVYTLFLAVGHGKELVLELLFICINENLFLLINYFDEFIEPSFILLTYINYVMLGYKLLRII